MRSRCSGVPSTVSPPGRVRRLSRKISRNCPCSAPGRLVPSAFHAKISKAGGFSPHQVVVHPVVEDKIVGAHPGEGGAHLAAGDDSLVPGPAAGERQEALLTAIQSAANAGGTCCR